LYAQVGTGGKVSIIGGDCIGHCEKNVHINMCLMVITLELFESSLMVTKLELFESSLMVTKLELFKSSLMVTKLGLYESSLWLPS